ncbi:MAG: ATP-dependent helicase [Bacillota bacterium]
MENLPTGLSKQNKKDAFQLRPGQQEVAKYKSGFRSVSAVPGAGKTTILAYLAAKLIANGMVEDKSILIVTYMNSAVYNFRRKINDFLEQEDYLYNNFEVRTIHSLAHNILGQQPGQVLINQDFTVIDDTEQNQFFQEILVGWYNCHEDVLKYLEYDEGDYGYEKAVSKWRGKDFPNFLKRMISDFKYKQISLDQASEFFTNLEEDSYLKWALEIYLQYQRRLNKAGLLDYTDLIVQASRLLEKDEQLLQRLQNKYKYVFEDEAQDSNFIQNQILIKLARGSGNFLKVGDSNQAIMSTFTLADPQVFREYTKKEKVEVNYMLESSRSTPEIIDLANYLVKWTVDDHPVKTCREALQEKFIKPVFKEGEMVNPVSRNYTIGTHIFPDSEQEIKGVVEQAITQTTSNPDKTLAILVPYNYILNRMTAILNEKNISYQKTGHYLDQELQVIQRIEIILNFLARPHLKTNLDEVITSVLLPEWQGSDSGGVDIFEPENIVQFFKDHQPEDFLYPLGGETILQRQLNDLSSNEQEFLRDTLDKLDGWLDASQNVPPDELVLMLAEDLSMASEDLALAQNIALHFKSELKAKPGFKLSELIRDFTNFTDQYHHFAKKIADRKGFQPRPGQITISTMHQAKGLEWDTVFITGLTAGNFPAQFSDDFRSEYYYLKEKYSNPVAIARAKLDEFFSDKQEDNPLEKTRVDIISEKLRLLYVAVTRARSNLMLTTSRKIIFESGFSREVEPALAFQVLADYIQKERGNYASS